MSFEINPITDEELAELKRLWDANAMLPFFVTMIDAYPGTIERLRLAEERVDELEAEVEELEHGHEEYETDCKKALVSLATTFGYEWDGDGATADDLREFVEESVRCKTHNEMPNGKWLADRDRKIKMMGAAEWLEENSRADWLAVDQRERFAQEAAALRERAR